MITIAIVGFTATIVFAVVMLARNRFEEYQGICYALAGLTLVLSLLSYFASNNDIPDGYERVAEYTYVAENGNIETIAGTYYKKGDTYYKKDFGQANWIPFAQCDFIEIELPTSTTTKPKEESDTKPSEEPSQDTSESAPVCPECGHQYEVGDTYCAGCGHELAFSCNSCGATLKEDDKFCPECGTAVKE